MNLKYLHLLTFFNKKVFNLLLTLLICDLLFIVLHCFRVLGTFGDLLSNPKFSLVTEQGYGEYFQYTKLFFIVVALGFVFIHSKQKVYLGWLLLFFYFLLDDSLGIHEHLGAFLAESLTIPSVFGMRSIDFGELLVSAFFGVLFLSIIAINYRTSSALSKQVSIILLGLLFLLAFFGVAMDVIHSITDHFFGDSWIQHIAPLAEDGGEHFTISTMLAFTFAVALNYSSKKEVEEKRSVIIEKVHPIM